MDYKMSKHASLSHFSPYFLLFGKHPIPPSSIAAQMDQVVDLDSLATWARVIAERVVLFKKRKPNDTLDTSYDRTILRIKAIRPSCVLELQGANECTIQDHSKNCVPCHLPNLDPTIITIDDANQMLLCDNCNGEYHLFCLKPELTQVPTGNWYCSSCSPTTL
ncbi:hypothetical protein CY35_15G002400 [Sphagnum magellanicum]|nr:hypothetical protein CY35_15G002400 [Sphagnum magellanicum]